MKLIMLPSQWSPCIAFSVVVLQADIEGFVQLLLAIFDYISSLRGFIRHLCFTGEIFLVTYVPLDFNLSAFSGNTSLVGSFTELHCQHKQ